MIDITLEYLKGLKIFGMKSYVDKNGDHVAWSKGFDGDAHVSMRYNSTYNYWKIEIDEYERGYQNGFTHTETSVRYVEELEMLLKMIEFKHKN